MVEASDSRPPLVAKRALAKEQVLDIPVGFVSITIQAEEDVRGIQLHARRGAEVRYAWTDPGAVAVVHAVLVDRARAEQAWKEDMEQLMKAVSGWNGEGELPEPARSTIAARRAAIDDLGDTPYAHLLRLRHASFSAQLTGPEDAWNVMASIPPDSVAWAAYSPWLVELRWFLREVPGAVALFGRVRGSVHDIGLQAAFRAGDLLAAERSGQADVLAQAYRDATVIGGPVIIGQPMPEFELWRVDDRSPIRGADLLGTPYLLDLWSTYCAPCIEQMEDLHRLHEDVGTGDAPRLRIVSVAVDDTREPILTFRQDRWPMPWVNVWVPGGDRLFAAWSLTGVPYAVLVDGDGRVLQAAAKISFDDARKAAR